MPKKQGPESAGALKWVCLGVALFFLVCIACGAFWYYMVAAPMKEAARARARELSCQNHLKIIGICLRTWALDHDSKFPFALAKDAGGTLELCQRDANGVDANPLAHFLVVSNEIERAQWLVCPSVTNLSPGFDWANLKQEWMYHLHTARIGEASPQGILAYCPVHHLMLCCDGSVSVWTHSEAVIESKSVIGDADAKR